MFSNSFSITLPNIGKYFSGIHFPGIHFPRNSLSKRKQLSCKQTEPIYYLLAHELNRQNRISTCHVSCLNCVCYLNLSPYITPLYVLSHVYCEGFFLKHIYTMKTIKLQVFLSLKNFIRQI